MGINGFALLFIFIFSALSLSVFRFYWATKVWNTTARSSFRFWICVDPIRYHIELVLRQWNISKTRNWNFHFRQGNVYKYYLNTYIVRNQTQWKKKKKKEEEKNTN